MAKDEAPHIEAL